MKYILPSVLLSVSFILTAVDEKKAEPVAKQEPVKKAEQTSFWNDLAVDTGRVCRKIRRCTLKALDITGSYGIRKTLETTRRDRTAKAEAASQFMVKHFADKTVALLLLGPLDSEDNKVYIETFNKATTGKIRVITISVDAAKGSLPLPDDEPTVAALNKALLQSIAQGADAVVNLAGLPARSSHCQQLIFWQWGEKDPRIYLTDAPDPLLLKDSLFPCPLAAAAVPRFLSEDEEETAVDFKSRYIEFTGKKQKTTGKTTGK